MAALTSALVGDELTVSVCTCCSLHYAGRTVAVIVSRASDPAPAHPILTVARAAESPYGLLTVPLVDPRHLGTRAF